MQRENSKIASLSQLGKILYDYYDWLHTPDHQPEKCRLFPEKKKGHNARFLYLYLRQYTQTMLSQKVSYYSSRKHYNLKEPNNQ